MRRFAHRVRAVNDYNGGFIRYVARGENTLAVGILHIQRVEQRQHFQFSRQSEPRALDHVGQVAVGKAELAGDCIVVLIEGAAGSKDA